MTGEELGSMLPAKKSIYLLLGDEIMELKTEYNKLEKTKCDYDKNGGRKVEKHIYKKCLKEKKQNILHLLQREIYQNPKVTLWLSRKLVMMKRWCKQDCLGTWKKSKNLQKN